MDDNGDVRNQNDAEDDRRRRYWLPWIFMVLVGARDTPGHVQGLNTPLQDSQGGGAAGHGLWLQRPRSRLRSPGRLAGPSRRHREDLRASGSPVGLPRIRFHDLRHTHTAHLIAAGQDAKVISTRLGHASVAFTYDRYGHLMPEADSAAALAVAALVDGTVAY